MRRLSVALLVSLLSSVAFAKGEGGKAAPASPADATYAEIKQAFGSVPSFMKQMPPAAVAAVWADLKGLEMNPEGAIPGKYRNLISMAVAAQIPCEYCLYIDTKFARLEGATDQEIQEAAFMAAFTRKASTILNGANQDEASFKKEADAIFAHVKKPQKAAPAPIAVVDAKSAMQDIQQTFGSVPSFVKRYPPAALAGFWMEMKAIQLNPQTAIPGKYKELIGLAVAAQVPCKYCIYFHTEAAKLNGATQAEIDEAIAVAGNARFFSTYLHGVQLDMKVFRREADALIAFLKKSAAAAAKKNP